MNNPKDSSEERFKKWYEQTRYAVHPPLTVDHKNPVSYSELLALACFNYQESYHQARYESLKAENLELRKVLERIEKGWHIMESDELSDIARQALKAKDSNE